MKKYLLVYSAMAVLLLPACTGGGITPEQHSTPALDSLLADSAISRSEDETPKSKTSEEIKGPSMVKLTIKDDTRYSKNFLHALTDSNNVVSSIAMKQGVINVELLDSLIIIEGKDTIQFPQDLPMGKWINFGALRKGYEYFLDLSMLNLTTMEFNYALLKGSKTIDHLKGKADLAVGFMLATEVDTDETTGESYLSIPYFYEDENCSFEIRLGDDGEGVKKVKVIKFCKSGKYNLDLDNCPILLEK